MSTGALTPGKAFEEVFETGLHHLEEAVQLTFLKNVYGAMLLSAGGLLSLVLSAGLPGIEQNNPGISRLMQGVSFPVGLIIVYFAGAELYTGYPMWYTMTAIERKGRLLQYPRDLLVAWVGNLVGALLFAYFFTYLTDALSEEPWRSGVVEQVTSDVLEHPWHVLFLRAIGCGYLVTIAMFLGTQNQDGISKALALHLPFFAATAAKFPHTVEYMYLAAVGMMLGAKISVGQYLWKCLLPITLGNTIGGAIFTGLYGWWVHLKCGDTEMKSDGTSGFGHIRLRSDE